MSAQATPQIGTITWNIDPVHSVAEFKVKHMMISNVKGQFTGLQGALHPGRNRFDQLPRGGYDRCGLHQHAGCAARCASEERRFLRRGEVPGRCLSNPRASPATVTANLPWRASSRFMASPATWCSTVEGPTPPAKDPWGNTRIGLSATTKINRKDFGLTWNAALETGGYSGRRRGDHHARRPVREGLTYAIGRASTRPMPCRGREREKQCHFVQ